MSTSRTIQSLEEEIASLKKEKRGLESVSVEKQTKIDVLAKEIEGLNDYDTRRNTEFENLQGEISRLESRLTSKESQLEDSRQLYDNQLKLLETQVKDFKANCNRVEGELSKTTTEAIELKLTLQAVEAERAQFNDQLQLSKAELSHLRGVVDDLTAENTKITEENETATIVARSGNRTLDEELSEEIDERGNFSPQVTEHEALDFSNILSVETTPGFAADDPKRTSSEISDSVDSALGFSMISASEQVPATPLSLRFNPIKTANTPVKLTYSRISSVDQAPEIRHRRSRFKPFGSFLEHRKSFSPTALAGHQAKNQQQLLITGLILGALTTFVLLALLWAIFGVLNSYLFYYIPSRHGYSPNGAYGNARMLFGFIPIGYAPGANYLHSSFIAVEKYIGIPDLKTVM